MIQHHNYIHEEVSDGALNLWNKAGLTLHNFDLTKRARKSRVYLAWRYEIHAIIGSLGTVRAQPRFRSHVKSMGDFRLLQITVI